MRINHRSVGQFSGPVISGKEVIRPPEDNTVAYHAERAYWLTGQVETGNKMGSIMMADGTAFTIGRDQHIAVYPRELADEDYNAIDDQGGAWGLLAAIEVAHGPVRALWDAFGVEGWYVSPDGTLRWIETGRSKVKGRSLPHQGGDLVHGATIRDIITPRGGIVEKGSDDWSATRIWATMFHELTAHHSTWDVQKSFGLKHLVHRVGTRKLRLSNHRRRVTFQKAVYGNIPVATVKVRRDIIPELDLALCVLHSHSVNAPSIAYRILTKAINDTSYNPIYEDKALERIFADNILTRIKMEKYGRWSKRWTRTRKEAMKVDWWDENLFKGSSAIMPK